MASSNLDQRPDPDILLQAVNAEEDKRGHLKIFFGACAGVGKTYAMLHAAHEKRAEGVNVMIGVVEAHGREDTERLLAALPIIPQKEITHRGITVKEFDLDAALAKQPGILLLDELAHTNGPGSRHPKRWQDVEELLDAGIDVYTTVNVQHLESLNDLVASLTGITVRETVPDAIFDEADDITLVDIPPDELLKRLKEGKVYLGEDVRANAAENFFKKSNLSALRELALRRTAERVDAQMEDTRILEGVRGRAAVADKIMVCVGPEPLSARLVRSAKRLATALKAPWVAVYVENQRHYGLNERGKRAVDSVLRMAERIGGKSVVLQGDDPVEEIMTYARANGFSKILVGKPEKSKWKDIMVGSLVGNLIRASGNDIDVYVITGKSYFRGGITKKPDPLKINVQEYGLAIAAVALATLAGWVLDEFLQPIDQVMIYLIGGVLVAARWGLGPSIFYSLLSVTCFNFFFVEPLYSLNFYDRSYWLTFLVMLVTSFVITGQASRLRMQAIFARKREQDTDKFYSLTRALASTRGHVNMIKVAIQHIEDTFNVAAAVWMPDAAMGHLSVVAGHIPNFEEVKEMSAISWCFERKEMAGSGTMTLPSAVGLYFPLFTATHAKGVLGVAPKKSGQYISLEEISSLEIYASILVSALERADAGAIAEQARIETEKEKLRNVLLSSVSHDLRTPLASIIGSSSSIMTDAAKLSKETIEELAGGIHREARRLSRIVTNLLDVTRLEAGHVQLNLQPYYVQELIGAALTQLKPLLAGHKIITQAEEGVPMVMADGTLIGQVLVNLLANAAKYTPEGTTITVSVGKKHGAVEVSISDQGSGIPPGEEKKIFDKFYTIGKQKGQKGTGLGLAICHAIIVAHGGVIGVENNEAGGARFHFTLPVAEKRE